MPLKLSIVTAEQAVLDRDDVVCVNVPTTEGQIAVLPSHTALMANLDIGELTVRGIDDPSGSVTTLLRFAVHGGFIQVLRDEVTVLADAAEYADQIDEDRAEAARNRAVERIEGRVVLEEVLDIARARNSLLRAQCRIRVRRKQGGTGVPSVQP